MVALSYILCRMRPDAYLRSLYRQTLKRTNVWLRFYEIKKRVLRGLLSDEASIDPGS